MKSIILAGSLGKQLGALVKSVPKFGLPLMGRMLIEYPLKPLVELTTKVLIVVPPRTKDFFTSKLIKYSESYELIIIEQKEPGITGALRSVSPLLEDDEDVVVAYGDIVAEKDLYVEIISEYTRSSASLMATIVPRVTGLETYGNVYIDPATNRVTRIEEKPRLSETKTSFVLGGVFAGKWQFFKHIGREEDIISSLNRFAAEGLLHAHIWTGSWIDVNLPWDLLEAVRVLLEKVGENRISASASISPTAVIEGPAIIDDGVKVDHYAVIKGPVYIGKNSFIGAHTLVREYSCIESNVIIGARSELKRSIVMSGSFVSSNVYLADSVVGVNTTLQPNVVTLSVYKGDLPPRMRRLTYKITKIKKLGAIIGSETTVPAGSIIKAGTFFE